MIGGVYRGGVIVKRVAAVKGVAIGGAAVVKGAGRGAIAGVTGKTMYA